MFRIPSAARFLRDQRAALLPYILFMFILILGTTGLVLDFGRAYVINTGLQAYADQVALAAAAELDNRPGAIARARTAAFGAGRDAADPNPALRKAIPFARGSSALMGVEELVFTSRIPPDAGYQYDVADMLPFRTTEDAEANYVIVVSKPVGIRATLLSFLALGGADVADQIETRAVAVATRESQFCETPILMFCDPWEDDPDAPGASFASEAAPGRQILMKKHSGGGADWTAGNFGTIDLPDDLYGVCPEASGNAASRQRCLLALGRFPRTCRAASIDMDPGQSVSVHVGLNTWFDIWDEQVDEYRDNPLFPPDANVIKGQVNDLMQEARAPSADGDRKVGAAAPSRQAPSFLNMRPAGDLYRQLLVLAKSENGAENGNAGGNGGGIGAENGNAGGNGGANGGENGGGPDVCRARSFAAAAESTHLPRDSCFEAGTCPNRVSPAVTQAMLQAYWTENHPGENGGVLPAGIETRYDLYKYELDGPDGSPDTPDDLLDVDGAETGAPVCTTTPGERDRRRFFAAAVRCGEAGVKGNDTAVPVSTYVQMFLTEPVVDNDGVASDDDIYAEIVRVVKAGDGTGLLHEFPHLVR